MVVSNFIQTFIQKEGGTRNDQPNDNNPNASLKEMYTEKNVSGKVCNYRIYTTTYEHTSCGNVGLV